MNFADAMTTYIQARRGRRGLSELIKIAVHLYWQLISISEYKPKTAQDIVDWYLA